MSTVAKHDLLEQASMKTHGRTFYWASFFLGKRREHVMRLYQLCRYVDDVADTSDDAAAAKSNLEKLHSDLTNENMDIPFVQHALRLKENADLPLNALGLLILEARDEHPFQQPKTEEDLLAYAFGVAGSVGYMMRPLLGCNTATANRSAIALGIAMQLTNIARDIGEDVHLNRLYIPTDWHQNAQLDFLRKNNGESSRTAHQWALRLLTLADRYYAYAEDGLRFLPWNSRISVRAALCMYRQIGEEIKKINPEQYQTQRAYLGGLKKAWFLFRSLLPARITTSRESISSQSWPMKIEQSLKQLSCHEP
jgi:15-cis-phytoene synthase